MDDNTSTCLCSTHGGTQAGGGSAVFHTWHPGSSCKVDVCPTEREMHEGLGGGGFDGPDLEGEGHVPCSRMQSCGPSLSRLG